VRRAFSSPRAGFETTADEGGERETTEGDDRGRRQRETTEGDDRGRRQRETTEGDDRGRRQRETTSV
jgi:hypothetical protein